jgi:dihydrofolate reductase
MSRVVAVEYISLDGVIQAPGHATEDSEEGFAYGGWTGPFMAEHRRYISELFRGAGAFLFGRVTYEIFAAYWPTVTDKNDDIARALNSLPKYVASSTLGQPEWRETTVIPSDVVGDVARLKQQAGGPVLVIGSSNLAQTLMRHNIIDEYQLWLHPVVLGSGKRLFREGGAMTTLRLVDSRTTGSGLVILTYGSADEARIGPPS